MIQVKVKISVNPLIHCLKNLGYFYQLTASHLRGLHICLWNDGSAERNGKGIQFPNYMSTRGLHNLGNYVWIYVH